MTVARNKAMRLTARHTKQIGRRGHTARSSWLRGAWALTFRPGNVTDAFEELYRPLGAPLAIALAAEAHPQDQARERLVLTGVRAQIDPATGDVVYGGPGGDLLGYDFSLKPHPGARGKILDPVRNPSLVQRGLEMDRCREVAAARSHLLATVPQLPTIYLGFAEERLPSFLDNAFMRAAAEGVHDLIAGSLEAMPQERRRSWLAEAWPELFVQPGARGNTTDHWLLPHIFADGPAVRRALRVYEYFGELLGADVWNYARDVSELPRVTNPAREVGAQFGVSLNQLDEWCDDAEITEKLLVGMRAVAEELAPGQYADDDLYEALAHPHQPLVLGAQAVAMVRKHMEASVSHVADCCTDDDLLAAVRDLAGPLQASRMAKIQRLYRQPHTSLEDSLRFDARALNRPMLSADFIGVADRWRHRSPKYHEPVVTEAGISA